MCEVEVLVSKLWHTSEKYSMFEVGMAKRASPPRIGPPRAWPAKMRDGLARPA